MIRSVAALLLLAAAPPNESESFRRAILEAHNAVRARHGAPALVPDKRLDALAQQWADRLVKAQEITHRPDNEYGENIAASWSSERESAPARQAVDGWYDEIRHYRFDRPEFSEQTGHFTQVVWRETRKVGCGLARTKNGPEHHWIVVCNYDPAGNVEDGFAENVKPRR